MGASFSELRNISVDSTNCEAAVLNPFIMSNVTITGGGKGIANVYKNYDTILRNINIDVVQEGIYTFHDDGENRIDGLKIRTPSAFAIAGSHISKPTIRKNLDLKASTYGIYEYTNSAALNIGAIIDAPTAGYTNSSPPFQCINCFDVNFVPVQ